MQTGAERGGLCGSGFYVYAITSKYIKFEGTTFHVVLVVFVWMKNT